MNLEALLGQAESGDTEAMRSVAMAYMQRSGGEGDDFIDALDWLDRAAEAGNVEAMTEMADVYRKVHRYEDAFKWEEKAANLGSPQAMYNLSVHYRDGLGVTANSELHRHWYNLGVQNGFPTGGSAISDQNSQTQSYGDDDIDDFIRKQQRLMRLIKVFAIVGAAGGLIFGTVAAISWSTFAPIPVYLFTGFVIGVALPSVWPTLKWTWYKVRAVVDFVLGFFNLDETYLSLIVAGLLVYSLSPVWGFATSIVTIVRFIGLWQLLKD